METTIEETPKKNKGFTLIELLIVIVILGVLATVTVLAVNGITDRGKTNACEADKKTLQTAAEAAYAQTGSYPATLTGFISSPSTKYTYAASAGNASAVPAVPAGLSYTITPIANSGCS